MTNMMRRKLRGRVATAVGSAVATVGFLVVVTHSPQPADAVQSAAPSAVASPVASSSGGTTIAGRARQISGSSSTSQSATQSAPRLRTRGS